MDKLMGIKISLRSIKSSLSFYKVPSRVIMLVHNFITGLILSLGSNKEVY